MDTTKIKTRSQTRSYYSHVILDGRKAQRREEAIDRQREHDQLTTEEKLAKAHYRVKQGFGNGRREIERLKRRLEMEKALKASAQAQAKLAKPAPMTEIQKSEKAVKRAKSAARLVASAK